MARIRTNKQELVINFQNDLLISKYGIDIDNNKNEEGKITYLMNTNLGVLPIKPWLIRNVKTNLKRTYILIKYYWSWK
ncbi:hypothetical protein [Staphylococcus gallinarum]|uniref:hypothetical protein n=1 Tax=Staphylococcus gallinarum TaxID=1293 RepID=UPI001C1FA974|nr:hypothetical protein [Staphylococcus gallinarum]MBU7217621.1 hypothetical protein [Staphylococcus gallinarum]